MRGGGRCEVEAVETEEKAVETEVEVEEAVGEVHKPHVGEDVSVEGRHKRPSRVRSSKQ